MRDAQDIQICNNDVMLHVLDPKSGLPPFLTNRPISLIGGEGLEKFFIQHIENGLKDSISKSAKFKHIDTLTASGICADLLNGNLPLIEGSQQLARCLNDVMEKNHNIASGDLIVCLFEADNYPGVRFLALIKIDPSEALLQEVKLDEQGHSYIDLRLQPNALPTIKEKLQKCAFIKPLNPRDLDYDMLLIDRQSGNSIDQGVAKFFIEGFLDAEFSLNATQRTERLYKALISSHNQIKNDLTPNESTNLNNRIRDAVTAQSINLDIWIQQLPLSDLHKQLIDQELQRTLPDREFDIDRDLGARFTRRKIFKGDFHLRLAIDSAGFDQIIKDEGWITDDPSRPPYRRIVIETEDWNEIPEK